jgi:hypothetical protein
MRRGDRSSVLWFQCFSVVAAHLNHIWILKNQEQSDNRICEGVIQDLENRGRSLGDTHAERSWEPSVSSAWAVNYFILTHVSYFGFLWVSLQLCLGNSDTLYTTWVTMIYFTRKYECHYVQGTVVRTEVTAVNKHCCLCWPGTYALGCGKTDHK